MVYQRTRNNGVIIQIYTNTLRTNANGTPVLEAPQFGRAGHPDPIPWKTVQGWAAPLPSKVNDVRGALHTINYRLGFPEGAFTHDDDWTSFTKVRFDGYIWEIDKPLVFKGRSGHRGVRHWTMDVRRVEKHS